MKSFLLLLEQSSYEHRHHELDADVYQLIPNPPGLPEHSEWHTLKQS